MVAFCLDEITTAATKHRTNGGMRRNKTIFCFVFFFVSSFFEIERMAHERAPTSLAHEDGRGNQLNGHTSIHGWLQIR